ncbi:hypothetical protein HII12_004550 [Brettanomyces bruxellensis]|uniref:Ribosomal RNA-processing protein 17 n=1 Tax=Dekkera bruxellensis TaxID=5007 RepID=A0A8H6ER92_DEKBR|nr:hypothetical protein HII12_004550 [Brettanomyces bruxellensis]
MARPNRDILSGGERYRSRKTKAHRVEEVTFDKEKRKEFLTGFHKRKLQRRKHAEEQKKEQNRLSRIEERAKIREARKLRVQQRLTELKELNEKLGGANSDDDDDDDGDDSSESDNDDKDNGTTKSSGDDESDNENLGSRKRKRYEEWHGFKEENEGKDDSKELHEEENDSTNMRGILKVKQVYNVQDVDAPVVGTSEVTIESMENPNAVAVEEIAMQNNVDLSKSKDVLEKSVSRAKEYARLMGMDDGEMDEEESKRKRRKKKQRKYLSKRERKIKKVKEKKRSMHRKNRL